MRGIVDRLEGNIAVVELESGEMAEIEIQGLAVSEGDVVHLENGSIVVDHEATAKRKKQIEDLFNSLLE